MYGMNANQEKALDAICRMAKTASFVAGQACEVLDLKTEEVVALLKALCVLGALECPTTRGIVVVRYRVSRECLNRFSAARQS